MEGGRVLMKSGYLMGQITKNQIFLVVEKRIHKHLQEQAAFLNTA